MEKKSIVNYNGKDFVMGISFRCKEDGTIGSEWKIIKLRSYKDVKYGECIDNIKYCLIEEDEELIC